jgi:uncharacterized membrane protein YdjX (TVP38/TMEM64 family)
MSGKKPKFLFLSAVIVLIIISAYVLGIVLLCSLAKEASWCQWWPHLSLSRIKHLIKSSGPWGIVVSIGLMVLHSFVPFPAEFIAIANGMVYGVTWGTIITWIGAMLGAFLAFGLARKLGRSYVHRKLEKKNLQMVEKWVVKYGGGALLVSRFIPVISFNLINYIAGLTQISWWTFTWATGFGILPITVLMVVMGDRIHTLPWQAWFLLLVAGLALWFVTHRISRRLSRKAFDKESTRSNTNQQS